jgi:ubiquinone/menaquinone biosynthesis C-methylase UbiE
MGVAIFDLRSDAAATARDADRGGSEYRKGPQRVRHNSLDFREFSVQSYYAARAPEYDAVYLKPERQADLRGMELWVTQAFIGASVLEIACGTGYWTKFISQTAVRLTALDAAAETIEIAKGRVPGSKVEFILGDAYSLPSLAGTFNAAFAGFWFSHVPVSRRREFLLGLNAVLQPNAKVILLDNRFVPGSSSAISERDAEGNTYQNRQLRDGRSYRVLKNFPSERDLRAVATQVGACVDVVEWEYYWTLQYVANPT